MVKKFCLGEEKIDNELRPFKFNYQSIIIQMRKMISIFMPCNSVLNLSLILKFERNSYSIHNLH